MIISGYMSNQFTWHNKRKADQAIFGIYDRALVNLYRLNQFPNINLTNLPIIGSNHGPILLNMPLSSSSPNYRDLKFEANWLIHDDVFILVKDVQS